MTGGCSVFGAKPQPSPTPETLVSKRGVSMPLEQAVREIAFRPYVPSAQLLDVALQPPLSSEDVPLGKVGKARGIAFEYSSHGVAMVLSEWPRGALSMEYNGFSLEGNPCTLLKYAPDSVLWTTRNDLVMTLQPDGRVKPKTVIAEAHRLLHSGACGVASVPKKKTKKLTPPRMSPRPASSSPPRSAS